jgi:hypothetical protein
MGRMVRLLMLLLVASATGAYAADVQPGEQVCFVERDQHIPAVPPPAIRACICTLSAALPPRSCT